MKNSTPLNQKKASELSLDEIQSLFRQNRRLLFQLSTSKERNMELQMKIQTVDQKYIEMEKQILAYRDENQDLQSINKELESQIQTLSLELKQTKHHSKPKHFQNQHLLAKVKILQDSLQKQRQIELPTSKQQNRRLPQLNPISHIQNYEMNDSFKDSPVKQIQSRIQNNGREKRFRNIVTNYQITLTEKNQIQQQCQMLMKQVQRLRGDIAELQSINHLLKQQNLEYKVRLSYATKATMEVQEQQQVNKQIQIQLLTESTNIYYSLLQSLISAGHSKQSTTKMKQILNLQIQELNQTKTRIQIRHHLEELEYLYRQENQSNQYQQSQLISRRKEIQQYRKKLAECNNKLLSYQTDRQNLLFELTSILRHQDKLVAYSLELQRKLKYQQQRENMRNQSGQQNNSYSFKRNTENISLRKSNCNIEKGAQSSRLSDTNKRRVSFYQSNQAENILKQVANKDKQMLEKILRSEKYRY